MCCLLFGGPNKHSTLIAAINISHTLNNVQSPRGAYVLVDYIKQNKPNISSYILYIDKQVFRLLLFYFKRQRIGCASWEFFAVFLYSSWASIGRHVPTAAAAQLSRPPISLRRELISFLNGFVIKTQTTRTTWTAQVKKSCAELSWDVEWQRQLWFLWRSSRFFVSSARTRSDWLTVPLTVRHRDWLSVRRTDSLMNCSCHSENVEILFRLWLRL